MDSRLADEQLDLRPSFIIWNKVIFESFQAGYLKPLDYDLCMGLSNSTAKRMYRFLDKRFHHKRDWTFDLKELAHEHIGLGRNYEGQAHLKRNLRPAIAELESIGFLEPMPESERFQKDGRNWRIRLIQKPPALPATDASSQPALRLPEPATPCLVTELANRGVTKSTAVELVQKHLADDIRHKLEVFDWLMERKDKRVAKSPAGYLVSSIERDFADPKEFVSKAERQRREEEKQAKERQAAEDRRRKQVEEARHQAEREAADAYWSSLSAERRSQLEAEALADGGDETRRTYETMKPFNGGKGYLTVLRRDYIVKLMRDGRLPAATP